MLRTPTDLASEDIKSIYQGFNVPIAKFDCGKKCAPHNPDGKPFCCDICHAVPAVYKSEWKYFQGETDLWHRYRVGDCKDGIPDQTSPRDPPTENMISLACLGPQLCQRDFRALSCRAFPFFPYISSDYIFLGLTCEWEYESLCWMISNLHTVTGQYRREFISTFDSLLAIFDDVFENYTFHSKRLRAHAASRKRRFPLLHRNGGDYLVSPGRERMQRVDLEQISHPLSYKATPS